MEILRNEVMWTYLSIISHYTGDSVKHSHFFFVFVLFSLINFENHKKLPNSLLVTQCNLPSSLQLMFRAFFSPISTSVKNSRRAQKVDKSSRKLSLTLSEFHQNFFYSVNVFNASQYQIRNIPRVHTGRRVDVHNS